MSATDRDHRCCQTPIRDQGDRQSCVGFAVSAAHEWMASNTIIRSPEDVLWAAHQAGGATHIEATSVENALTGLTTYRHASEAAWPYGNPRWPAARPIIVNQPGNSVAIPSWRRLSAGAYDAVTSEIASGSAVVLTLRVVVSAWCSPQGLIDAEPGRKATGNHAVVAVGFTDGASNTDQHVIVKNSWGPDWGDEGYGYATRRYLDNYALLAHVLEQTP